MLLELLVFWLVVPSCTALLVVAHIVRRLVVSVLWLSWAIVCYLTATKLRAALLVVVLALAPFVARGFLRLPLAGWQNELLIDTTLQANATPDQPIHAIMVLGYSCYHRLGLPTAPLEQRLQVAFEAACHQRLAPLIVLSGGRSKEINPIRPTESEIMAHWLLERLLDPSGSHRSPQTPPANESAQDSPLWRTIRHSSVLSIVAEHPTCRGTELTLVLEKESTSTVLNARKSLEILDLNYTNVTRVLLVTSLFHQWRSRRVFERAARDLDANRRIQHAATIRSNVDAAAATATRNRREQQYSFEVAYVPPPLNNCVIQKDFWRELAAIALYFVAGWI